MAAGIQILHNTGTVQIDENSNTLFVLASGTGGTIPTRAAIGATAAAIVAVTSANIKRLTFGSVATGTDKWYVFDVLPVGLADPGYGFQIFNSSGKLIFDATRKPMRYVGSIGPASWSGGHTYLSGRTYAVVMMATSGRWLETSEKAGDTEWLITEHYEMAGARVSANTVTLGFFTTAYRQFTETYEYYPQGATTKTASNGATAMVIDVTGY